MFKNGLKSRKVALLGYEGHSIKLEHVAELETLNREPNLIDLQDLVCKMPTKL